MKLLFEQMVSIIKTNPGKKRIDAGRKRAEKYRLHIEGEGMDKAFARNEYFQSEEIFDLQKKKATSNVDLFSRILQLEDMVFMARGGSSYFKLPDQQEAMMNEALANVEYGMSLRKWIRTFGLPAYRCDPQGVFFMEIEPSKVDQAGNFNMNRCYPTYKSINSIYDYETTGRRLEWICFELSKGEAREFGINDESLKDNSDECSQSIFYRLVDDAGDLVFKRSGDTVSLVTDMEQPNPIPVPWKRCPGFVVSDIINYKDPGCFLSPLHCVIELADTFLNDRSIRDLQKYYHGFAKAIEPLLLCGTCGGTKVSNGRPCSECAPAGGEPTGYKLKTKISDVARFPLDILEKGGFDFSKIFGYVSPDIKTWEKQDQSLEDIEQLIEMTYWGMVRMKRPKPGASGSAGEPITATESDSNQAPKEARLNMTADWVESTENLISDFIGEYLFPGQFKKSSITIGRDYVLRTWRELMDIYQRLRKDGASEFAKTEALERVYYAKYQNNPVQLQKFIKMLHVEPFPHDSVDDVEKSPVIPTIDKLKKRYFTEWASSFEETNWVLKKREQLTQELTKYCQEKESALSAETAPAPGAPAPGAPAPSPAPVPGAAK